MSQLSLFKGLVGRVSVVMVFVVGAVGLFLMMGGLGEGQEVVFYPENGTATVVAYIGDDPEGQTVTWSLGGADAGDFEIDGGALTFITPPDYEDPQSATSGTLAQQNVYKVTVQASDGTTDTVDQMVEVRVTNEDDLGEIRDLTVQPQLGVAASVSLEDPDGPFTDIPPDSISLPDLTGNEASDLKWQWARGTSKTGSWTDIDDRNDDDEPLGESSAYTPAEDDLDKYLRVTVTYLDGHCPCSSRKTAQDISDNKVIDEPFMDEPPVFDQDPDKAGDQVSFDEDPANAGVQITIAENSPAGTAIGAPIAAKALDVDGNQRTLNYTLDGNDRNSFDIDQATGQISVSSTLDHETKDEYEVSVMARYPPRHVHSIVVTIEVTDVDEDPMITGGAMSIRYDEIIAGGTAQPVGTSSNVYRAEDHDANDTLRWSLSGPDASKFTINDEDQLEFKEPADFEARADSGRDNVYNVTVVVTDSAGNTAMRDVVINVADVEEPGVVRLSNRQPQVGTKITATLSDGDIVSRNSVTWDWSGEGTDTSSGTSSTYTPVAGDNTLTATATYTDGRGSEKMAFNPNRDYQSVQAAKESANQRPMFDESSATRSVDENLANTVIMGGAFEVNDDDDINLTYSLSRGDLNLFSIDWTSGVISTKAQLDYEDRSSHSVTVTVTDASLATDTISVTINVIDVDEIPMITDGETAIEFAEITGGARPGPVATYKASNPDKKTILWSLSATDDADDFSISSGGVLTFNKPPDHETKETYSITVTASDGGTDDATRNVTVTVLNVDEPGQVALSDLEPQESTIQIPTPVTAMLTDPDGDTAGNITWQWARSASRSGPWTNIRDAGQDMYAPTKDDVGKYLRATASYTDGHGVGKEAHLVSNKAVRRTPYVNKMPMFLAADGTASEPATRSIAENSKLNAPVGDPVAATDIGANGRQENLTYTLSGDDAAKFDIDRRTGQIKTKTTLNYESDAAVDNCTSKNRCMVIVTAADSADDPDADLEDQSRDTIAVTINVTNVDEAPVFDDSDPVAEGDQAPPTVLRVAENQTEIDADLTNQTPDAPTYTATDPENGGTIEYTLAGTDADHFKIENGVLSFREGQDYEDPADSGGNRVYNVTVQATDEGRNTSSVDVVVTVTNAAEPGMITLSHLQPQVGESLTARLTDPDGGTRSITWQWYRGPVTLNSDGTPNGSGGKCSGDSVNPPCSIDGATSATYSPVTADHDPGLVLTLIARYTDRLGSGQRAIGQSVYDTNENGLIDDNGEKFSVQGTKGGNKAPRFLDTNDKDITTAEREILENAVAGAAVGSPVEARDEDDMNLDYSLSGTDAGSFEINRATGQIKVKAALDYESTKKTYTVDVRATDPEGLRDSIRVTIRVLGVDEKPELLKKALVVRGDRSIGYAENSTDTVGNYTAAGPNATNVSWSLTGADAGDFSISRTGQLTFRSTPNFESPADSNRDNTYVVTVNASTRSVRDTLTVTVDVANADEEGEARLSPNRGNIGSEITATVTDLDGTPTNVLWEWERSEDGDSGWTSISGASSGTYTPDADDVGNFLRATARYADPQGPGKRAEAITTAQVRSDDDGVVTLSPARLSVGDTVTARVTDPDGNIRNTTWQWESSSDGETGWSDIIGTNSATYTIVAADIGDFLRATANYDDGDGTGKSADGVSSLAVVEDDDGSVTLSQTRPQVGSTVTATLRDPDGGITGTTWQWASSSNGTTGWSNLSGATSATYTVVDANVGDYLRATANYADAAGTGKSAEGITAAAVIEDDDGSVTLSPSSPEVGNTVTATLSDPDGAATAVTWVWEISSNGTTNWSAIIGETSNTYRITAANLAGSYLRATASYTDPAGPNKSAQSASSGAIREDDDGAVTLSLSSLEVGDTVTATLSDPDAGVTGVTWQWAFSANGSSNWSIILGATSAGYTATEANVGNYLRATATYTDAVGSGKDAEAVTSGAVTEDDDGVVTLSTSAPEVLTAITATLSDPDRPFINVRWQWAKSSNGSTWTDISRATSARYTPAVSDEGSYLRASASYDDSVGAGKSAEAATGSRVAALDLLGKYDTDRTGSISRSEATQAVRDYFSDEITKEEVITILMLYFAG